MHERLTGMATSAKVPESGPGFDKGFLLVNLYSMASLTVVRRSHRTRVI